MPQTNSQINACDAVIKLQTVSGNLMDISGSSNEVSMDLTNDVGQLTTFQARFPVRSSCKSDATINLRVIYTMSQAEAMQILKDWYFNHHGTIRRIQIYLPDDDAGSDMYQFDVILASLNIPVQSSDANPILVSAVLNPSGAFTLSTVAS